MTAVRGALLAAGVAAVLVAGCGDDGGDGGDKAQATATKTATATAAAACEGPPAKAARGALAKQADLSKKPRIAKPSGDPPAGLQAFDVVEGKGACATPGSQVSVQYVGVSWSTGEEFDASWSSGQPFAFALGAGQVIPGWDQGVAGMRVGGRRELVIPPDLAYGSRANGPIKANETLVFVVDLEDVG